MIAVPADGRNARNCVREFVFYYLFNPSHLMDSRPHIFVCIIGSIRLFRQCHKKAEILTHWGLPACHCICNTSIRQLIREGMKTDATERYLENSCDWSFNCFRTFADCGSICVTAGILSTLTKHGKTRRCMACGWQIIELLNLSHLIETDAPALV